MVTTHAMTSIIVSPLTSAHVPVPRIPRLPQRSLADGDIPGKVNFPQIIYFNDEFYMNFCTKNFRCLIILQ